MGAVPGVSPMNKFGTNEDVGTSFEDIWEQGGKWVKIPTATTLEVASTSTLDTLAGTGAQKIMVSGLDANYDVLEEEVELTGQTPVLTTGLFLYVNRAYVTQAGTTEANQGIIRIADDSTTWATGVPATASAVQAQINTLHGQTQQCIYTVPRGFTAFVAAGYLTTDSNQVTDIRVAFYNRLRNCWRVAFEGTIRGDTFTRDLNPYVPVLEKNTVLVEAKLSGGAAAVSAGLDMILVTNDMLGAAFDLV
jgi:lipopolysaccharide export system protein LptA